MIVSFHLNKVADCLANFLDAIENKSFSKEKCDSAHDQFYFFIQQAVLSGEYYAENAKELVESIKSDIEKVISLLESQSTIHKLESILEPENLQSVKDNQNEHHKHFSKFLQAFKTTYLIKFGELVNAVKGNMLSINSGKVGVRIDTKHLKYYKLKDDITDILSPNKEYKNELLEQSIFDLNILLAYIDEYLECNDDFLADLKSIRRYMKRELRNNLNGEIFDLIVQKAGFLEYKINFRNRLKGNHFHNELVLPEGNVFNIWKEKIHYHYERMDSSKILESVNIFKEYKKLKSNKINFENIDLEIFHHLNKYYKHEGKDLENSNKKLLECFDFLKKINHENCPLYEVIAIKSTINLLFNSRLFLTFEIEKENEYSNITKELASLLFDKKNSNKTIVWMEDRVSSITEHFEHESPLADYYCYLLCIQFLNEVIAFIRQKPATITDEIKDLSEDKIKFYHIQLDKLIEVISKIYKELIVLMKLNLKKVRIHEVKSVYLLEHECLMEYVWRKGESNEESGHLFMDSSYILPTNYIAVEKKLDNWESYIDAQLTPLKNSLQVEIGFISMKDQANSFEKKVKESEFKTVQIVAMFVSIATFVLINVKIFDGKTGMQSFGIMMGLAACFFLFNLFFYFLILIQVKGFNFKRVLLNLWILVVPLLFGGASFYLLNRQVEPITNQPKFDTSTTTTVVTNIIPHQSINKSDSTHGGDSIGHK